MLSDTASGLAIDIDTYRVDGYLSVTSLLSRDEIEHLRVESVRLCRGELGDIAQAKRADPLETDEDVLRRYLCIHFPHKLSPYVLAVMAHPNVIRILEPLVGPNIKAMQSMLFIKAEGKPGQAWHQDEYFIPTRDKSLTAVWIALDDATVENGCLWVIPGSHRRGVIYPERETEDERFDCNTEAYSFPYADTDAVPVEVPAGGAVVFNGYLLHRSLPNVTRHGLRRALASHYMSASSLLPWRLPREGEHMAIVDDRDVVLVAGEDPYAYKGTEDLHGAMVRPEREGGCDRSRFFSRRTSSN